MSFEIHPWKVVETGLDKERMAPVRKPHLHGKRLYGACAETLRKTTQATPI